LRIGVFDSGWAGCRCAGDPADACRTLRSITSLTRPGYRTDRPWRGRSSATAPARSASFLTEHGADILVVACNTATAAAVPMLRQTFSQPVVGMEPAVKPATAATRNGKVGVLATVGTLQSARFAALLDQFGAGIEVLTRACPGLVEQVEAAELDTGRTRELVRQYVAPLINAGVDTLVLGCTHFTFLRPLIQVTAGQDIQIIDTGAAVARRVAQVAEDVGPGFARASGVSFWTSADPDTHAPALHKLWGERVRLSQLPMEYC
jgi:glutamate racemase